MADLQGLSFLFMNSKGKALGKAKTDRAIQKEALNDFLKVALREKPAYHKVNGRYEAIPGKTRKITIGRRGDRVPHRMSKAFKIREQKK